MKKIGFLLSFFLMAQFISAQQLTVPGEYSTIQAAIVVAVEGDSVVVAEGTYVENINFLGKAITVGSEFLLDGDTAHISRTIIDGSAPGDPNAASVVSLKSGEDTTSVLTGFTIMAGNGTITQDEYQKTRSGGGVLLFKSGGKIIHNIIKDNHLTDAIYGYYGCGLYAYVTNGHTAIIRDNVIKDNSGTKRQGWGCGVHIFGGNVIFEDNEVLNNVFNCDGFSFGGGVMCWLDPTYGTAAGAFLFKNNIISSNSANSPGADNAAGGGMAIYYNFANGNLKVFNNVISKNTTTGWGGGLYTYQNKSKICNNTFVDNEANVDGNSLLLEGNAEMLFFNNIVWSSADNGVNELAYYGSGGTLAAHYNILKANFAYDDRIEGEKNTYLEPTFVGDSYELAEGSSAVGRAIGSTTINDALCNAPVFDFNGKARPNAIDEYPDAGAFESEFAYVPVVSADLAGMNVRDYEISPEIDPNVYNYHVDVPDHFYDPGVLKAIPVHYESTVDIVDAADITSSNDADRTSIITVTASDGETKKIYNLRFDLISTDATLSTLTISNGFLQPEFKPSRTGYTVELHPDSEIPVVVEAITSDPNATIEYIAEGEGWGKITRIKVRSVYGNVKNYAISLVSWPIGIEQSELGLSLYPNPFSETLHLEFNGQKLPSRIEMINMTGSLVKTIENISSNKITIDRGALPAGLYFVKVYADQVYVNKVMIQ